MKYKLFIALFTVGVLIGCSHINESKRVPTSVKDVGVIGPDGEVLLYYKDGDYIIVKACDPYTILDTTPAQAQSNCQGKSNKVPVETFKQSLKDLVSISRLNVLKPLTPEEVEAYSRGDSNSDQIEAMLIELDKINNFIATYGAKNANLVRKEELVKALSSKETLVSAIKKINTEVQKAVNLISNKTKLTITKFDTDKDQFLYTALKQFNPNEKFPCGLTGPIVERIRDCSYQSTSKKEGFVLVTRSKDFKEVHQEISTGLLWSDKLKKTRNHYNATRACNSSLKEVAGISDVNWRLPSIKEYKEAEKNGIRKALPNMNRWFWSSSVRRLRSNDPWLFDGVSGKAISGVYRDYFGNSLVSVRCVARNAW